MKSNDTVLLAMNGPRMLNWLLRCTQRKVKKANQASERSTINPVKMIPRRFATTAKGPDMESLTAGPKEVAKIGSAKPLPRSSKLGNRATSTERERGLYQSTTL